jgi:hypothetical protein
MEEGAAVLRLRGNSRSQATDNQNKGVETSCQTWIAVHSWVPLLWEALQLPFSLLRPQWRLGRAAIS